ncbi:hypothetical protein MES4922_30088 [Mesorhizobium ventifaucium]|uniref:Transposase n=1 Tax=Mesorhizobium ventifaucium TaxID=666020 RepID=A0ABN8JVG3_9HYPH|nr:hypothetical protein MES4922_30088 [Mesorhizobium ventifaucium]
MSRVKSTSNVLGVGRWHTFIVCAMAETARKAVHSAQDLESGLEQRIYWMIRRFCDYCGSAA